MSSLFTAMKNSAVELLEPSSYGEYLLRKQNEILYLLRQLLVRNAQITIFFNEGADLILTTLLAVTDDNLIFDIGASADINQRALEVNKLFCVTLLDKVRVQFILCGLALTTHGGRAAFRTALPDNVLRLQRREYYRLIMPLTRRLPCQIPLADSRHIEVAIVDLSGGGMAMVAAPDSVQFEPEMEFPHCRFELPETGIVTATIKVMTSFEVTMRNGIRVKRAGCKFIDLSTPMINMIQRYITRMERERKAHESGLL
jgi:flagellar brake protein